MPEEKTKLEQKEKVDDSLQVVQVATQTTKMYKLPSGEVVEFEEAFAWLCNQVYKIKKTL